MSWVTMYSGYRYRTKYVLLHLHLWPVIKMMPTIVSSANGRTTSRCAFRLHDMINLEWKNAQVIFYYNMSSRYNYNVYLTSVVYCANVLAFQNVIIRHLNLNKDVELVKEIYQHCKQTWLYKSRILSNFHKLPTFFSLW